MRYAQSDTSLPLPGGYFIRYLIYALSDGHIERSKVVSKFTLSEAIKWNHFRSYERAVQDDMMKKATRG